MAMARVGRWELLFVATITLLGGALRAAWIGDCGLSHFDAGIYAQSGLWPYTGEFHPYQGYYSPPLFPILIGITNLILGGPTDFAGAMVSVAAGTLLIPLGWWVGRAWFRPLGGVLAALAICLSGFHIVFARVGLTDALFTLLFVAGFAASRSAMSTGGWSRIVTSGILVGLAWNTKYNGFLPLILAAGYVRDRNSLGRFSFTSLFALLLYLPWAIGFHVEHGYSTLLDHQRGYVQGVGSIAENWNQVWRWLNVVETPSAAVILLVAAVITTARGLWANAAIFAWLAATASLFEISLWAIWIWLPAAILGAANTPIPSSRLGNFWAIAWLLFLPAVYAPYLRLWLPSSAILLIFCAGGIAWLTERKFNISNAFRGLWPALTALGGIVAVIGFSICIRSERLDFWVDRGLSPQDGYRKVVEDISIEMDRDFDHVYTLCRWPANYYLLLDGIQALPLSGVPFDLGGLSVHDRLLVDRAVFDTPSFRPTVDAAERTLNTRTYSVEPDLPTLLDDYHGAELQSDLPAELERYRLREFWRPR